VMYSDELLRRFYEPTHVGEFDQPSGRATDGNPTCGDVVQVAVRVDNGIISDARFKTFGCAVAIAASDAVCEMAIGQTPGVTSLIDLAQLLGALGPIEEERVACVSSAIEAIRAAARDSVSGAGSQVR
jgi:nitrogen fixation NifU-like protein